MTYFHGTCSSGIDMLEPRSHLHGTARQVAYLTDCPPCALFYLWDAQRTGSHQKHVTGGIRDGAAFYEEQFPHQLEAFYKGVSGWLYEIAAAPCIQPMPERPRLFYAAEALPVSRRIFIPDAYEALLAHEAIGQLRILRYTEQPPQRQRELTGMIAAHIRQNEFFTSHPEQRAFMQRHFAAAWAEASEQ